MSDSDSKVLGQMSPEEISSLSQFRMAENEITFAIGQKVREVLSLAMQAGEISNRSQALLSDVRTRFDIDDNVKVRIMQDGTVERVEEYALDEP